MKHQTTRALYAYWNTVRANRLAPQRFEIDPSRISGLLPYTFILERDDAETFRFRLAGTRMCEIFGRELRGTNFLDGWPSMDRGPLLKQFANLTRQGAVSVVHLQVDSVDEGAVECEVLLLPLLHTLNSIDRVLGCFSPLETPAWLGETPVTSKRVLANELVWPTRDPLSALARTPVEEKVANSVGSPRIVVSERRRFQVFDGGLEEPDRDNS